MSQSSSPSSVFASPAVALLCDLETAAEDAGTKLSITVTAQGRLRIAPLAVLTDERTASVQLHRDALRLLAWCCDDGVQDRRTAFLKQVAAAPGPGTPALSYRDEIAITPGQCVSCGDAMKAPVWCWRCQLAARLALCGDVPVDWIPAGGGTSAASVAA